MTGVVFLKDKFVVLVQVKGRSYLMNPAGHRYYGESFLDCVIRNTKEETELKIKTPSLLSQWTYNYGFGGLSWVGKTVGYYGEADCLLIFPFFI